MNTLLLLLLDSRAPAGTHHHSGGMEAAVGTGLVTGLADLEDFCRAKLRTSARVSAAFAAAACRLQSHDPERAEVLPSSHLRAAPAERPVADGPEHSRPEHSRPEHSRPEHSRPEHSRSAEWAVLDAEFEARTPSEAMRAASRQLGGGLLRLLRSVLPDADLVTPWERCAGPDPKTPHHPLVLGAGVGLAGGSPELAARAAALSACASPATAAVRLLGLDPFAVQAMLARLAPGIDECARSAALAAWLPPPSLPADAAPALDLLADYHLTAEVRLFAS
jgi:urease accessory protein